MSHRTQILECTIRSEIEDWFKKLINETFGAGIQLRYLSNDEHFKTHTHVEIIASEGQINDVIEFIGSTSELLQYRLPWLNVTTYYVVLPSEIDLVTKQLNHIMSETDYDITTYYITGCPLIPFNFRPDLDDTELMQIDEIFKALPRKYSLFFTFPKARAARRQSTFQLAINILRGYHGAYLQYLNLEDILSLEMANNDEYSGCDGHLHHDIQMYLRSKYPDLYKGKTIENLNFREFRINEVLRYFIHKYHNRFQEISISNILTADEIQLLSRSYNIDISCNKPIHIDFKSANGFESVDFCAVYHFDPNGFYFVNYGSENASENHAVRFKADGSLEPLKCSKEFTYLVIKSQNSNSSPQKTNSVLKCVTEHFRAVQNNTPCLVLHKFELGHVSKQLLSSVMKVMRNGRLEFHKTMFTCETLNGILEQSSQNLICLFNCRIVNVAANLVNSRKCQITFYDMDVDLNLLCSLDHLKCLETTNCRIVSTSWNIPIITTIYGYFLLKNTTFDVVTFVRLLYGLRYIKIIILISCQLTPGDLDDQEGFIFRKQIKFQNMIFKIQTLLQILTQCEFQKRISFKNCQFHIEKDVIYRFRVNPVQIQFHNIRFDTATLLVILASLNTESYVWIDNSIVLSLDDSFPSTKIIKARYVDFEKCRLETNSLLNILGNTTKQTRIMFDSCNLLHSNPTILTNLSEMDIAFKNMTIDSVIAESILQTNSEIIFDSCDLPILTSEFLQISIPSDVSFVNMTFDSAAQLNSLAKFTSESTIRFQKCSFEYINLEISNIVIKPLWIYFMKTSFDITLLHTIMERISENTTVYIEECVIQTAGPMMNTPPVKIKEIRFLNMSLQIETILCILKGFTNLIMLGFRNCKILCTNRVELPDIKLKPSRLSFRDMTIGVQIFQTLMSQCTKNLVVLIVNCRFKSSCKLPNKPINIRHLIFKNVNYSAEVLELLQYLNEDCSVRYSGQLSNQAIIEICTKSSVHGDRLWLPDTLCTKSFYFELFAEFFRAKALNLELDTNFEYDLPTYLVPLFENDTNFNQFNWDEFKIKLVEINDGTAKLEFLKNGKVIDLFFELNGLPDDSGECIVDYY